MHLNTACTRSETGLPGREAFGIISIVMLYYINSRQFTDHQKSLHYCRRLLFIQIVACHLQSDICRKIYPHEAHLTPFPQQLDEIRQTALPVALQAFGGENGTNGFNAFVKVAVHDDVIFA